MADLEYGQSTRRRARNGLRVFLGPDCEWRWVISTVRMMMPLSSLPRQAYAFSQNLLAEP
jgi:hypothetical protein